MTNVLDLGIIAPATFIAGVLILRSKPLGYLVGCSLLVLEIMLLPMIVAQMVSQLMAGITFTPAQIIGPMVGFSALGLSAFWVMVILLRKTTDTVSNSGEPLQQAHA